MPGKLTDRKYYEFDLQPERVIPGSEIVARAEEFRQTAHADGIPHVGGSAVTAPPAPIGSMNSPLPNFAPIVPGEMILAPSRPPSNPSTFVPPAI
jgi:hypothetical protein